MRIATAMAVLLLAMSAEASADATISQKGRAFSEKDVTIKAGEAVQFVNDDDVTHNVYSTSSGQEFDVGAQKPGETVSQTFAKPGKVKVRCAIHPKMKLTVNVE